MYLIKKIYYFLRKKRNLRNLRADVRNKTGIGVSYHYINDRNDDFWGKLKKITPDQFERQIRYFKNQGYKFISISDYLDFLEGKKDIPNNFCFLSFDDGLSDHYNYVYPILKKFNIKGCFFPLPKTLDGKISPVHKIHILLEKIETEDFAEKVNKLLEKYAPEKFEESKIDNIKKTGLDRQKRMEKKYEMDGILRTNLKYNLAILSTGLKNKILDDIFSEVFEDEERIAKEFYLSKEQIKEMSENGMEFGGHTIYHPRLGKLSKEEQKIEIEEGKKKLEEIIDKKVDIFSYPYGSYSPDTFEILKENGFRGAVTIKQFKNIGLVDKFLIHRLDVKDFPY